MKTCAICTTENAADAVTCVGCGEGSFGSVATTKAPLSRLPSPPAEETPSGEPAETFRGTGGKRRGR